MQIFNKNVDWNVKETFFNLHVIDKAAFDQIRLSHLKKYLLCNLLILKWIRLAKQRKKKQYAGFGKSEAVVHRCISI